MGFIVSEELEFKDIGVFVPDCYITIKGAFSLVKQGSGYLLTAKYLIYAAQAVITELEFGYVNLYVATPPATPYSSIYTAIKALPRFANKTITDDL